MSLGVPVRATPDGEAQMRFPLERGGVGGAGPAADRGGLTDGAGRGWTEGGASQRRSARFFPPRS